MSRRNFGDGIEITFQDLNKISSALERSVFDRVAYELMERTHDAFFGNGFRVSYISPTSISVAAGLGLQNDASAVSPEPTKKPLYLPSAQTVNLTAPNASLNRIDIVCVRYARTNETSENRKYKSAVDSSISTVSSVVQTDALAEISVVAGTPNASPVAPSVPSGYIKIAELLVTAVTGMSGSGAVTDSRTLMPLGANMLFNTSAFQRITAGSSTKLSQILSDIDTLLKSGYQNYTDFDVLADDPSNPSASRVRFYQKNGIFYFKDSSGTITPVGSGSGGGAGASWYEPEGEAPIQSEENGQKVFLFPQAGVDKLVLWVKVPSSYLAGRPITMNISAYSPSTSNTFLLRSVATLVRKNNDAVSTTTNQRTSTNAALTNSVANRLREISLDLTSSAGGINSVAVSAGDMLKIELSRGTDTDTDDVRFIPSATEIIFG